MAGHNELVVTAVAGNDTEGVKVTPDLVEALFGDIPDAHIVNGLRDNVKLIMLTIHRAKYPSMTVQQSWDQILQGTTDLH